MLTPTTPTEHPASNSASSGAYDPSKPILEVQDLSVSFHVPAATLFGPPLTLKAVNNVSFNLHAGETLGVVGESGCGKSTLARAILQLLPASGGNILWMGENLINHQQLRNKRSQLQIIFQDPLASLNPRMTAGDIVAEPLKTHRKDIPKPEVKKLLSDIFQRVGLSPNMINRYPHEFSGGQCQRIGIARAMILKPKLIVCDEPVSALDVSIQAQIVNLLQDLQREFGLAMIFISHDLSVVRHICHRIMVLYLGRVVEVADRDTLYTDPKHPYTKALMSAIPIPDPKIERERRRIVLKGDLPSPINPPSGCPFRGRCAYARPQCAQDIPILETLKIEQEETRQGRAVQSVACHFHHDLTQTQNHTTAT
ncbi:MAG: ATP-binding cassette domain-containing protein [Alphaproteobacteria bacterium]